MVTDQADTTLSSATVSVIQRKWTDLWFLSIWIQLSYDSTMRHKGIPLIDEMKKQIYMKFTQFKATNGIGGMDSLS